MTSDTMLRELREALLPSTSALPIGATRACKLCNHPAHLFAQVDFNKSCNALPLPYTGIGIEYHRCQRCELLFTTAFDHWSKQEFAHFVYNEAYIEVDPEYAFIRPQRSAEELAPSLVGAENLRILDYGSGDGIFEQEMRARGFSNVESYDLFSKPERPQGSFSIVTCFDVIEHSPDPHSTLADIMSFVETGGLAMIGQTLQPADITVQRGDWWYIAPRNGHVTTFSCETLHLYAEANDLRFFDFGDFFALSRDDRSKITRDILTRRRPQIRRLVLASPPEAEGVHESWHDAENAPSGKFRWTREAVVGFGTHETPRGQFRVVLRHMGRRNEAFLASSRICVGTQERAISVHEDDLFAVFDLPYTARRQISLRTPPPYSDAAAGIGADLRPVGLAIGCEL